MAQTKCTDIDKYLHKEIAYLDDLIIKANNKQNKEYKDFWSQCSQVKNILQDQDDHRMDLVKRVLTVQDYLGVSTGGLEAESISLSGKHNDVADGSFVRQFVNQQQ